jgi:hypothetical protein
MKGFEDDKINPRGGECLYLLRKKSRRRSLIDLPHRADPLVQGTHRTGNVDIIPRSLTGKAHRLPVNYARQIAKPVAIEVPAVRSEAVGGNRLSSRSYHLPVQLQQLLRGG